MKRNINRLALRRETVRALTVRDRSAVYGGSAWPPGRSDQACPPPPPPPFTDGGPSGINTLHCTETTVSATAF